MTLLLVMGVCYILLTLTAFMYITRKNNSGDEALDHAARLDVAVVALQKKNVELGNELARQRVENIEIIKQLKKLEWVEMKVNNLPKQVVNTNPSPTKVHITFDPIETKNATVMRVVKAKAKKKTTRKKIAKKSTTRKKASSKNRKTLRKVKRQIRELSK